jgi:hypothetical protein
MISKHFRKNRRKNGKFYSHVLLFRQKKSIQEKGQLFLRKGAKLDKNCDHNIVPSNDNGGIQVAFHDPHERLDPTLAYYELYKSDYDTFCALHQQESMLQNSISAEKVFEQFF